MHGTIRGAAVGAIEIHRHATPSTGKFAGAASRDGPERITFGDLARFACPRKTAAWLAHITGFDVRTCERWLAGRNEPPAEALGAIMFEIMRRFHQRAG